MSMTVPEIKMAFGVDNKGAREFLYESRFARCAVSLGGIRCHRIMGVWHLDQKPSSKKAIERAYMDQKRLGKCA